MPNGIQPLIPRGLTVERDLTIPQRQTPLQVPGQQGPNLGNILGGIGSAVAGFATGGALPIALQAGKAVFGGIQAARAKKELSQLEEPEYQIPQEIVENLTAAEAQALEGLPAAQKRAFVENIQQSTAQALASGGSRRGGLIGLGNVVRAQSDAFRDLLAADVGARERKQSQVMQAKERLAQYKDRAFEEDQASYEQRLASGQATLGAGVQNIFGGIDIATALLSGRGQNG